MKKKLVVFAIISLICSVALNMVYAQLVTMNTASLIKNEFTLGSASDSKTSVLTDEKIINKKALKNFAKIYKNVKNQSWYTISDGFTARFFNNNVKNTVYYDTKGRWSGVVKNYSESQLPVEIRNLAKRTYFDYTINGGVEIETLLSEGKPTYIIYIEDKQSIKWLRVYDGEMEVYNEFSK